MAQQGQGQPGVGYQNMGGGDVQVGGGGQNMGNMGMPMMKDEFPSLGGADFPSLGGRPAGNGAPGGGQQFGGLGGLGGVANMAYGSSKSKKQSPEFNMSEDMFPALPGGPGVPKQPKSGTSPSSSPRSPGGSVQPHGDAFVGGPGLGAGLRAGLQQQQQQLLLLQQQGGGGSGGSTPGMQGRAATGQAPPSPASKAAAARPRGMVGQTMDASDRYGLLGLLKLIRMSDQDLKTLALGTDLTLLGLNLNSPDVLFPSFQSPWADTPLRPKEPPFQLPACYKVSANLPPVPARMAQQQLSDETLFYVFYSMPGDVSQSAAAAPKGVSLFSVVFRSALGRAATRARRCR